MKRCYRIILIVFLLVSIIGVSYTQESQTMKLLALKRAQLSLEERKGDFNRALKLKEEGSDIGLGYHVEANSRFVEEKHLRHVKDRAYEFHLHPFA